MARKADRPPGALNRLEDEQERASRPDNLVWLSASAGTGKTQVLTSRVLRLLLKGEKPESILCLTFTKAGASEMANRINQILARWVMASDNDLYHDLEALGEVPGPEMRKTARTLFARLLDARGGGLRIQTIHSFCQSLLGGFPLEAGLAPGFRLIEERDAALLSRTVFGELMAEDEATGVPLLAPLAGELGLSMGEEKAMAYLRALAPKAEALRALPDTRACMKRWMHTHLSGGNGDLWEAVRTQLADPVEPMIAAFAEASAAWGTKTGLDLALKVRTWLAADLPTRIQTFAEGESGWLTASRTPRKMGTKGAGVEAAELAIRLFEWSDPIHGLINLAAQADRAADAVLLGRAYALRHARAKAEAGFVDYDDLIRRAVALLQTQGMGEWVRKKLDQSTDHVLIDEAQDTNAAQWDIIKALTEEYFTGASAAGDRVRTLFTVGDYKQAIFGFQGTDPENFRAAQEWFAERASWVERDLLDLSLTRSFRSAQPILDVTDSVIAELGFEALGMDAPVPEHHSADGTWPGEVILVPPVMVEDESAEEGDEEWLGESERLLAARIADQIHDWWKANPLWIARKGRFMVPGDVRILLRKRGELARLLVARLNERGIPVAGLDRLRLGAPLAVQDLLACARFAMQPEDDLNLAALLVSPLVGLTQEQLYEAAKGRKRALWPHLEDVLRDQLMPILNAADMTSPYRFFETILSGPMQGRTRLLARLGDEARDPLDALLSAALDFEASHPPSLQLFLDWFDRSDADIKRDAESGGGAVRVMTAHGAKGLQAPIVILADATGDPTRSRPDAVTVPLPGGETLPLPRPSAAERTLSLKELDDARKESDLKEHRRLLYVALTRAEERLLITGALKKGEVPATSWHAAVGAAMDAMQADSIDAPVWATAVRRVARGQAEARTVAAPVPTAPIARPLWLDTPPAPEAAPQRPLSPSSLGHDDASDPPPSPTMAEAAERGRLLHALFERLPALPQGARRAAGERWLSASAGVSDTARRADLLDTALSVINDVRFAHVFMPEALAEAPLAGVVDGFVVAGTVDRLLVDEAEILIVDFKTGRFVPRTADALPVSHLRQMAAYAALLAQIFPDRPVRAALLYTHGPSLIDLPPDLLARHKPDLAWQQEVLQQAG